jgi:hypothetical protein
MSAGDREQHVDRLDAHACDRRVVQPTRDAILDREPLAQLRRRYVFA